MSPLNHIRRNTTGRAGFTLVEILMVLFIIGIMAALVVPRIGIMDTVKLKTSARKIAGTIRITYNTAVLTKIPHRMVFDLENHVYWVEEKSGEEYVASSEDILQKRALPSTVYLDRVRIMDRSCETACKAYLYFTPGGYVEEAEIYLSDQNQEMAFTVLTRPMTGKAAIVAGVVSRAEWLRMEGLDENR